MSNNGTGFWVVLALIAAFSIATMIELAVRMILPAPTAKACKMNLKRT